MSGGGLSSARLGRPHDVLGGHTESGGVPGLVWLVARHGEVHTGVAGRLQAGGGDPVRLDTIFRISSMTKPVTAVAALILVEECRLRLDEPVDRLLPELADRRVMVRSDGSLKPPSTGSPNSRHTSSVAVIATWFAKNVAVTTTAAPGRGRYHRSRR